MKKNYRYEIVENAFHGGAHIAYATTLESAIRALHRHDHCTIYDKGQSYPRCCCGGPQIRKADGSPLSKEERTKIFYD